jgi:hypothetical protein
VACHVVRILLVIVVRFVVRILLVLVRCVVRILLLVVVCYLVRILLVVVVSRCSAFLIVAGSALQCAVCRGTEQHYDAHSHGLELSVAQWKIHRGDCCSHERATRKR